MNRKRLKRDLKLAQDALLRLCNQRDDLDREIARTRQYVQTLWIMSEPRPPYSSENTLHAAIGNNLTEAVRVTVMASTKPLNAIEIRDQVIRFGFDITSSNPLASVYSVLKRLIEQGEIYSVYRLFPDGEPQIFTRAYWWGDGENYKLPKGWVLETKELTELSLKKGTERVRRGREQDRAKIVRENTTRDKAISTLKKK
jgi:hypothetical protein